MKKLLCILMCVLTAFCFAGCKEKKTEEEKPVLIELAAKALNDDCEFAIVDDSGTKWLENSDVNAVIIMYKKGHNRYLELRFNEEGVKKFKKAVKKNKNGKLSITLDGELLASPVIANKENTECGRLDSKYEDVIDWFNKLT